MSLINSDFFCDIPYVAEISKVSGGVGALPPQTPPHPCPPTEKEPLILGPLIIKKSQRVLFLEIKLAQKVDVTITFIACLHFPRL